MRNENTNQTKGVTNMKFKLNTNDLNNTPLVNIFGYLASSQGLTSNSDNNDIVEKLFSLKNTSETYSEYIESILHDIISGGDIYDYKEALTFNKFEFVDIDGVVNQVQDLSWI